MNEGTADRRGRDKSVLWIEAPIDEARAASYPAVDEGCDVLADCLESEFAPVRGRKTLRLDNHMQVQAIIDHLRAAAALLRRYDERFGE